MKRSNFPLIITLLVICFLYIPMIIMGINSFNASRYGTEWTGFTLKWYELLWTKKRLWSALGNSLLIGSSAALFSTVLGTLSAFAFYRFKSKLQNLHYAFVYIPLMMPDILMGISLLLVFVSFSIPLSLVTVFIAHVTFCVSYVTLVILSRLQHFDYSTIEAALDLGASPPLIIWKIVLPQLLPALISGALLAFTVSIDDYIITFFVSGPGSTTLPLEIYSLIKSGATPVINALSTLLLSLTFLTVPFIHFFSEEVQS
mgnify:CR=1 FL=1